VRLFTVENLRRAVGMYFQGWLDESFRESQGLRPAECGYFTLVYAADLERSFGYSPDFSVISSDDFISMALDGVSYARKLNLHEDAAIAIADDSEDDTYLEVLHDVVWARDRLQCFIDQVEKHLVRLESKTLRDEINNLISDALYFDYLFIEEHPVLAAVIAEGNQWLTKEFSIMPLPGKAWWYYKHLGLQRSKDGEAIHVEEPTYLQQNLFYLSKVAQSVASPSPGVAPATEAVAATLSTTFSKLPIACLFNSFGRLPKVAADPGSKISRVAILPRSFTDLRFPLRKLSEDSVEPREIYAVLETPPFQDDSGKCYAQWNLRGIDLPSFNNDSFYLTDSESGSLLGEGVITPDGVATLNTDNWEALSNYSSDVSQLLFIVKLKDE